MKFRYAIWALGVWLVAVACSKEAGTASVWSDDYIRFGVPRVTVETKAGTDGGLAADAFPGNPTNPARRARLARFPRRSPGLGGQFAGGSPGQPGEQNLHGTCLAVIETPAR